MYVVLWELGEWAAVQFVCEALSLSLSISLFVILTCASVPSCKAWRRKERAFPTGVRRVMFCRTL